MQTKGFYTFKNAADGTGDSTNIEIVGDIGSWWSDLTAEGFVKKLAEVETPNITLDISSLGGNIMDALTIYDAIRGHRAYVTARLSGVVASAATVIASAADKVVASPTLNYMIHKVWSVPSGNADQLRQEAAVMDKFDETLVNIYKKRTNLPESQIRAWLDSGDTWFTAKEALSYNFVDEVKSDYVFSNAFYPSAQYLASAGCRNIPTNLIQSDMNDQTISDNERKGIVAAIEQGFKNALASLFPKKEDQAIDPAKGQNAGSDGETDAQDTAQESGLADRVAVLEASAANVLTDQKLESIVSDLASALGNAVKPTIEGLNAKIQQMEEQRAADAKTIQTLASQVNVLKGLSTNVEATDNGANLVEEDKPKEKSASDARAERLGALAGKLFQMDQYEN